MERKEKGKGKEAGKFCQQWTTRGVRFPSEMLSLKPEKKIGRLQVFANFLKNLLEFGGIGFGGICWNLVEFNKFNSEGSVFAMKFLERLEPK